MEAKIGNSFGFRKYLVGAGRFERPTPCAQGRCATRLRYAPTVTYPFSLNYFARFFLIISSSSGLISAIRF